MPKPKRYEVTGPGVEDVSYDDIGPGLSRTITFACKATTEATFYLRDSIGGRIVGFSERDINGYVTTRRHG